MELLSGKHTPIDDALQEKCSTKMKNGDVKTEDIRDLFSFFSQVCNNNEEIQYEMNGMIQTFQFNLGEKIFSIVFLDGKCESFEGAPERPTVIFNIHSNKELDIVTGNIHSSVAQMNGDIEYTGPRPDAIAFQQIFELFLDEYI